MDGFHSRLGRVGARGMASVVLAFVLVGVFASAASAHATLKNTSPPQSAVFKSGDGPRVAVLGFDEPVLAAPDFLKVYDGAGRAVPGVGGRRQQNSQTVQAPLPSLRDGTYVAIWHIISADGHPEQGAFTFTVGKPSTNTADIGGLLAQDRASRGVGIGFGIDRAIAFLGCLFFVGGLMFARWAWPELLGRRSIRLFLGLSAYLAIAASLLSIPFEAAYGTGDTNKLTDPSAWSNVVHAHFGTGALWRAGVLIFLLPAIVLVVERTWSATRVLTEALVAALGLALWATFAYAGHGDTGRLVALGFSTDMAHLTAASIWLGGVAVLALGLRGQSRSEDAARAAVRFSMIALPAIAIVVLSGIAQGWRQLGSWDALWHTTYGRLLIVKAGVVVGIVIIASAARDVVRDRLAPNVRGKIRPLALSAAVNVDGDAVRELRNGIWSEVALAIAVLGVTSVLVFTAPGREAEAAAARPVAHTVRAAITTKNFGYQLAVQPALAGPNTLVIAPSPQRKLEIMPDRATATMTGPNHKPVNVGFTALPDGRFVASQDLADGTYTLVLTTGAGTAIDRGTITFTLR